MHKKLLNSFLSFEEEGLKNPHGVLGLILDRQSQGNNYDRIRLFRPGAKEIFLEVNNKRVQAKNTKNEGIFEVDITNEHFLNGASFLDYKIFNSRGDLSHDPYAFDSTISDYDIYLFNMGVHYEIYNFLGAHKIVHQDVAGTRFLVWAPNAKGVSLVGDFNYWDGRINPMRFISGFWEIFMPGLVSSEKYKYEIRFKNDEIKIKADPFAFYSELRPKTASITYDVDSYKWNDSSYRESIKKDLNKPINIYEVHLSSWKRRSEFFPNYKTIAKELCGYCKYMGYTHVELLPIMEHPLDDSWGYQVTGFYAPTARYGTPSDFQYFVDYMHQGGIGVILDWVPAHFPNDDFSLSHFDGTALYEYDDILKKVHPHWNTHVFNYEKREVVNFLIGSALFWFDKMHIDGFRVDAVASMIYLDYGRQGEEWVRNKHGGNHNLEAIEFLKHLNSIVHERFPNVLMIAEESTSFFGVTHPLKNDGMGFDLKWNMGWMNDTLSFFSKDPIYRKFHHHQLTFSLLYAFSEKFILVLSHDEVVHGKKSLFEKMPNDEWQKMANLKLLHSYKIGHPGKKLFFMGNELGQKKEWDFSSELEWNLLQDKRHLQYHNFVRDLNHFYLEEKSLWEEDFHWNGFSWVSFFDSDSGIISYLRKGHNKKRAIFFVHHFTNAVRHDYYINLANVKSIKEVYNTDDEKYGGSDVKSCYKLENDKIKLTIPPLATLIFEVHFG